MNAKNRLLFIIEHLGTPFVAEIKRDLEEALNDAKADELELTIVMGGEVYSCNNDGSTVITRERRIKKLRGED